MALFTARHFETMEIACALDCFTGEDEGKLFEARFALASIFENDNPRFDRERFLNSIDNRLAALQRAKATTEAQRQKGGPH